MNIFKKIISGISALCMTFSLAAALPSYMPANAEDLSDSMEWGMLNIGGGGFVSGIVTGKNVMYARTDVGGAYKYNFNTQRWEQLMSFITEQDKGYLSVDAMCVDPTDDNTVYMLCGCGYFSDARTAVFKTTDGGKTWIEHEVTDLIQVHGNGYGRQCGEAIAVDPDNPDIIYCGGDATAGESGLIMSRDGGETWEAVKGYGELGLFTYEINWPTWTTHKVKTTTDAYDNSANGVGTIAIADGKVYVGTSVSGTVNMHVADVGSDDFKPLSSELPDNLFPSRINKDADGNLLICYVGGLAFNGASGGIYRYNIKTGEVTNISPSENGFGSCVSMGDNSDELIATTCGVWSLQRWDDTGENDEYGEWLYRSDDGGKTWTSIYPGKLGDYIWNPDTGECKPTQLYDFLDDGGYDWVYGKAIHWSGSLVLNPNNPEQVLVSSGNGVFQWNNIWGDSPEAVFHPDGIEEVVCLDFVSTPEGKCYSAIYDYDGFIHTSVDTQAKQYKPNMGSTVSVAYCPQNPEVLVRTADKSGKGYYTLDDGETWTEMDFQSGGGKSAISKIDDNTYRIFKTTDSSSVSYSDDFGKTWNSSSGISGSKTTYLLVEPENPSVVYAYTVTYNEYWYNDKTKTEPTFDDAHYSFYISTDGGKTFTGSDIAKYDQCDQAGRIAYISEDNVMVGAGWYGMYNITDSGKNIQKTDVYYCKSIGYGAPEHEGDVNTLYMWGMPSENDKEGIYRSQDGGKTWDELNTDKHFGGTGNGNFIVGDMSEFGTVYMSTVGMGIVYGQFTGSSAEYENGDINGDGIINAVDALLLKRYILGEKLSSSQSKRADMNKNGSVDVIDEVILINKILK